MSDAHRTNKVVHFDHTRICSVLRACISEDESTWQYQKEPLNEEVLNALNRSARNYFYIAWERIITTQYEMTPSSLYKINSINGRPIHPLYVIAMTMTDFNEPLSSTIWTTKVKEYLYKRSPGLSKQNISKISKGVKYIDYVIIGQILRERREKNNMSASYVSDRLNLLLHAQTTSQSIINIENCASLHHNIKFSTIDGLCEIYRIHPMTLMIEACQRAYMTQFTS